MAAHRLQMHRRRIERAESASDDEYEEIEQTEEDPHKRWRNWWIRVLWTCIMIALFLYVVLARAYLPLVLVMLIKMAVYREVIKLAAVPARHEKLPLLGFVNWYFFFATNYYLYGETVLRLVNSSALLHHHRFVSYSVYLFGFVIFVLHLKKRHYRFQFTQFAWTHMSLLLIVVQGHAFLNCIFDGLFWFVIPVVLVIVNDCMAYVCGFFIGKTPLIRLSPKKTWEGFIGGAICTLVCGFFMADFLISFPYFTCPIGENMHASFFDKITCKMNPVFVQIPWTLYVPFFGRIVFDVAPAQLHVLVLAVFASSIAPFGGFFASGIKRAFRIKDFGDLIPGHGGFTDRFDCQLLMGTFSYIYVTSFVGDAASSAQVIELFKQLTEEEKLLVYNQIASLLTRTI